MCTTGTRRHPLTCVYTTPHFLFNVIRTRLSVSSALLDLYGGLLDLYGAFLDVYGALLDLYGALLDLYGALLDLYGGLFSVCGDLLNGSAQQEHDSTLHFCMSNTPLSFQCK